MWHLACDALYYTDGYGGALIRGCHSACLGEDVPGAADVLGVSSFAGPRVAWHQRGTWEATLRRNFYLSETLHLSSRFPSRLHAAHFLHDGQEVTYLLAAFVALRRSCLSWYFRAGVLSWQLELNAYVLSESYIR